MQVCQVNSGSKPTTLLARLSDAPKVSTQQLAVMILGLALCVRFRSDAPNEMVARSQVDTEANLKRGQIVITSKPVGGHESL